MRVVSTHGGIHVISIHEYVGSDLYLSEYPCFGVNVVTSRAATGHDGRMDTLIVEPRDHLGKLAKTPKQD